MTVDPSYGLQQELRPKPQRWGAWATLGWGAAIAIVYFLAQMFAAFFFVLWWDAAYPDMPFDLETIETNGPILGAVTLFSTVVVIGVVLLAVELSRVPAGEYLALRWPTLRNLLIGLLATNHTFRLSAGGS